LLQCFPTWFLFCYNVSPDVFFFQNYLCRFFKKNIELVESIALTFPTCFSIFFICFLLFFFQNCLLLLLLLFIFFSKLFLLIFFFKNTVNCCRVTPFFMIFLFSFPELSLSILFFSYWASWKFSFVVFSLKHYGLLQCYPTWFFLWFFSKLSLSILLFLILSWLRITTVNFLMKHYRLLQCFPAWFFFPFNFFMIFSKIFFVHFIF